MKLSELKNKPLQEIRSEDVSGMTPRHPAFEVEHTPYYSKYVYRLSDSVLELFSADRDGLRTLLMAMKIEQLPAGVSSLAEYYRNIFQRSLQFDNGLRFLGYVDPVTFEPIEETMPRNKASAPKKPVFSCAEFEGLAGELHAVEGLLAKIPEDAEPVPGALQDLDDILFAARKLALTAEELLTVLTDRKM